MKKIIIALITLIGVLLIIIGIYLIIHNDIQKKEVETISTPLTNEEYNNSYSNIISTSNYFETFLSNKYPIENVQDMTPKNKTKFILDIICGVDNNKATKKEVKKEMSKYFLTPEVYLDDIEINGKILYKYSNNIFTNVESEDSQCIFVTNFLEEEAFSDYWILKKKAYYINQTLNDDNTYSNNVYITEKDCDNEENSIYSFTDINYMLDEESFDKLKQKLKTITYTYKKNSNKYYIEKIEIF